VTANVSNNIVQNTALNGIFIQTRDPSAVAGNITADVTVRNNTVGPISDDDDFPFGAGPNQAETHAIRIESRNDSVLRLDIANNSADGLGGNQDYLVRQRDTSTFALERLTGSGTDDTNIQNFIVGQNPSPAGQTARATHATRSPLSPMGRSRTRCYRSSLHQAASRPRRLPTTRLRPTTRRLRTQRRPPTRHRRKAMLAIPARAICRLQQRPRQSPPIPSSSTTAC
jgi:hypothetical protein